MTESSGALRTHWCHSVGLRAKQGRGDKSAKATAFSASHDSTTRLKNFPLASRSGASEGCLGACVFLHRHELHARTVDTGAFHL